MGDKALGVGIIGAGGMGRRHALNIARHASGAAVVAVMDADSKRAKEVAAECGAGMVLEDAEGLIDSSEVDAVVLASPDETHAPLTLACIEAGKPVLAEKPLAMKARDAETICRAEIATGRRLVQVGFMREYDPAHRAVKAEIERGAIGTPVMFRGYHYNHSPKQLPSAEDLVRHSGVHDIHSARWLMGCEVARVHAQSIAAAGEGLSRFVLIQLSFGGGELGVIQLNADSGYGYEVYVEVTGETGQVVSQSLSKPCIRRGDGLTQPIERDWLERFAPAYIEETNAWTRGCVTGALDGPSAWDGYATLAVAQACMESIVTGMPADVQLMEKPAFYNAE